MQPNGEGECKSTIVLPAVSHIFREGKYRSELGAFFTSKVKTEPSGSRVQPSSALKSLLPLELTVDHFSVAGSSKRICLVSLFPIRNLPLGRTTEGESPMKFQPLGGATEVQVLAFGS